MGNTPVIRLDLLGPVRLTSDGRSLDGLARHAKRVAILTYLVLHEGYVRRDALLALFWPESTDRQARSALTQAIFFLRGQLGTEVIEGRGNGELRISAQHVMADVIEFRRAMAEERFGVALDLYRGELLAGLHVSDSVEASSWLDDQRTRFRREAVRAGCRHAEQLENAGWPRKAEEAARRALEIDPSDESAARLLISILLRAGSRPAAIAAYEAFRNRLESEFGLKPSPETTALLALSPIESSTASPELQAPSDSSENAPTEAANEAPEGNDRPVPRRFPRSWKIVGFASLAVATGLLLYRVTPGRERSRGPDVATPTNRVTVLYFDPRGDVGEDVAASLTEALIDQLSTAQDLTVISASGVRPFRGRSVSLDTVAAHFRSGSIITGTVAREGSHLELAARLVFMTGAGLQKVIHANCTMDSPATAPSRCVRGVNTGLRQEIGRAIEAEAWRAGTRSAEAWKLLDRALELRERALSLVAAGRFTQADRVFADADSLLANASAEDRRWAAPHLLRARVAKETTIFCVASPDCDRKEDTTSLRQALAQARRSIQLQPADPAGYVELGTLYFLLSSRSAHDGGPAELDSAEETFRRARSRAPGNGMAWSWLSTIQSMRGEFADAYAAALAAYQIDENDINRPEILMNLFQTSLHLERDSAAFHWCGEMGMESNGTWPASFCRLSLLAFVDSIAPNPDLAWKVYRTRARADASVGMMAPRLELLVAAVLGRAGMKDSAQIVINNATVRGSNDPELDLYRAGAFAASRLGDSARAAIARYVAGDPPERSAVYGWRWFKGLRLEAPVGDESR